MSDKEFPNKYLKILKSFPDFKDAADGASVEELKEMVLKAEKNIYVIEQEKAADMKLAGLKEQLKDINGAFSDAKKCQTAKLQYALYMLESKGQDMDSRD